MRVEVTLDSKLQWMALQHAVVWKEPVADVVETAIVEFLKSPMPTAEDLRANQARSNDTLVPAMERVSVMITQGMYASALKCATSLGITMDQLLDMSVKRFCHVN